MGGDVEIESAPGEGTTVRLLLPAVDPPPQAPAASAPAAAAAPACGRPPVLYVEDEPLVRFATAELLESAGYTVREAADAERALAMLDAEPGIALMVTDVGLPRMNGHELAAEARRRRPGLKVVFLTGYDRDRSADALRRDAGTRYLDKPYQPDDLFRALRELSAG
jgi:CheY-like chemotaxis protein